MPPDVYLFNLHTKVKYTHVSIRYDKAEHWLEPFDFLHSAADIQFRIN